MRRWLVLGLCALLPAAALLESILLAAQIAAVAPRADWRRAGAELRRVFRRGDLIVTAPDWADPLGRLQVGDLMTLRDVTRPDAGAYGRILELSIRGARHPDTRGARARWRRRFGAVTLTAWERRPVRVVYDFFDRVGEAQAWSETGSRATPQVVDRCRYDRASRRHRCQAGWLDVTPIYAEVGYRARRCLLLQPYEGRRRVLAFARVPPGQRLVVYTGLRGYDPRYRARRAAWEWRRWRPGGRKPRPRRYEAVPVTLEVAVGGKSVLTVRHPIADEGWRAARVALAPRGGATSVRFTVTTRFGWGKHFCFYARVESDAGGGGR